MMVYEKEYPIDFYDLDGRGSVKLTALLRYINLAAGANAEEIGVGLDTTVPMGLAFVLQRFALRVSKWPVYRQTVKIRTWPAEISKGTFRRNGDMWGSDGKKMAEWTGLWVLIDIAERRVRRPTALPVEFPAYRQMNVNVPARKLEIPAGASPVTSYLHVVRFSELDINMHMNNAIYGDLITNVMEIAFMGPMADWRDIQFNYLSEAKMGDEINVELRQADSTLYVTGSANGRRIFGSEVSKI